MAFMPRASHVLQWRLQSDARPRGGANRKKVAPVRIVGWQLACMKSESLVIAYQLRRGECVPEFLSKLRSRAGGNYLKKKTPAFACGGSGGVKQRWITDVFKLLGCWDVEKIADIRAIMLIMMFENELLEI